MSSSGHRNQGSLRPLPALIVGVTTAVTGLLGLLFNAFGIALIVGAVAADDVADEFSVAVGVLGLAPIAAGMVLLCLACTVGLLARYLPSLDPTSTERPRPMGRYSDDE